jgi:hypothetical protein
LPASVGHPTHPRFSWDGVDRPPKSKNFTAETGGRGSQAAFCPSFLLWPPLRACGMENEKRAGCLRGRVAKRVERAARPLGGMLARCTSRWRRSRSGWEPGTGSFCSLNPGGWRVRITLVAVARFLHLPAAASVGAGWLTFTSSTFKLLLLLLFIIHLIFL